MSAVLTAWRFARAHVAILLGALAAIGIAVLRWGSLKRQNASLAATVKVEHAKVAVAGNEARRDAAVAREVALGKDDAALANVIAEKQGSIASSAAHTEELSNAEVIKKLNEMREKRARRSR